MKSGFKIIWAGEASKNLESIIAHLLEHWTEKEIRRFVQNLDKRITLISQRPEIFRIASEKNNIRRSILSKHNSIYYKVNKPKATIEILTIWDNRQNPQNIKL